MNTQGLERGHLLVGPLYPGGRRYLFMVIRAHKNSVQAVTHLGDVLCEITLKTHGLYKAESEWKKVYFTEEPKRGSQDFGGVMVDGSYMRQHGDG